MPYSDEDLQKCFRAIDTDNSGAIDKKEMRNCLIALGVDDKVVDKAVEQVMKDDPNLDGKITFAEFKAVVNQ